MKNPSSFCGISLTQVHLGAGEPLPAMAAVRGVEPVSPEATGSQLSGLGQAASAAGTSSPTSQGASNDKNGPSMKLLNVPRSCFHQILLVPDMFGDHLPDAYVRALQPVIPQSFRDCHTYVEVPDGYT